MICINISPPARWPLMQILMDKGFEVRDYSLYRSYLIFDNGIPHYISEAKGNTVAYLSSSILPELALLPKEAIETYIMANLRYK